MAVAPHRTALVALAGLFAAIGFTPALGQEAAGAAAGTSADPRIRHGEYVFHATGCYACHTDTEHHGPALAGGAPIKTSFGTFYPPNITPDPTFGIGKWTDTDFLRALRDGVGPDGEQYYPAFPYGSFTKMTDEDILDLKAYIFTLPAVSAPSHPQDVPFWLPRFLVRAWKMLNFEPGPLKPDPAKDAQWNRGRYLVEAAGHCGECHTPRTLTGGLDRSKAYSGNPDGPDGKVIPNITPDATGIKDWSESDITYALKTGSTPDGDVVGSLMSDVVDDSTSFLTDEDRLAIARYLKSLPPIAGVARPDED